MPWVERVEREKKKRDFELAFEEAWEQLLSRDPNEVARRSLAEYDEGESVFSLRFMGTEYQVKKDERVSSVREGERTNPFYAFLIVHYLIGAKDIPLANKHISFRELYGGDVYYQAFKRRAIDFIKREFESRPEELMQKGIEMGGEKAGLGDFSVTIPAFPKLPITIILWLGDDEVPTNANILFDRTAGEHLHTEDIAAISEDLARRLSS
ncbi:MAG: DUF3786 domain-containing protein [Thermoplasmata archaeon]|nr:DUF3786 domain-containing protein [Thermoplasmata archaeon]